MTKHKNLIESLITAMRVIISIPQNYKLNQLIPLVKKFHVEILR